jgi:hypothetical protein
MCRIRLQQASLREGTFLRLQSQVRHTLQIYAVHNAPLHCVPVCWCMFDVVDIKLERWSRGGSIYGLPGILFVG